MTLTDPREALADQADFIGYLLGLAGLARVVHTLAADGQSNEASRTGGSREPDDFVHVLLGLASIGAAIEGIASSAKTPTAQPDPIGRAAPGTRWLR
jgi:hypothetical protein